MSDNYQAVYDAVRSKIQGFDMRTTFQDCLDFSREKQDLSIAIEMERAMRCRPSVIYRPDLARDGDQWSALYGDNIMVGVCGFGDSPEDAMLDFDKAWYAKLKTVSDTECGACGLRKDEHRMGYGASRCAYIPATQTS